MIPTVILGAGGHAKVIIDVLRSAQVFDPVVCLGRPAASSPDVKQVLGVPLWGDDDQLERVRLQGIEYAFIAIGDNRVRGKLMARVVAAGFQLAQAIAPSATISSTARLGQGVAILPGAHVGTDTQLGDGCILNTRAIVDHDGCLGRCVHIGPGVALAGSITVGDETFVATGSSVIPHRVLGARSMIGAGSVVVRDIPDDVVAYGVPARVQRSLLLAGEKSRDSDRTAWRKAS